jgi:phage/plasmid-associated DNA primase
LYVKNSTGGGMIDTDQKNRDRLQFMPYYKATVDSNEMPYISDTTIGMQERFCKIDMPWVFVDDPKAGTNQRKKDPFLGAKMTTPTELSGILNLIIARAPEIIKTKRIIRRNSDEMTQEYIKQSNSVTTFLDTFCDFEQLTMEKTDGVKPTPRIYNDVLYAKYCEWCVVLNADIVNEARFGTALKFFCDGQKAKRTPTEKDPKIKRHRYQLGLSFDKEAFNAWKTNSDQADHRPTSDRLNTDSRPDIPISVPIEPYSEEEWNMFVNRE